MFGTGGHPRFSEDIYFTSGSTQEIIFNIVDRNGQPASIVGSTIKWTLSLSGQSDNPIIKKDNLALGGVEILEGGHGFKVLLSAQETSLLENGRYEHEPIIIQPSGKIIRPAYGFIDIREGSKY